MQKGAVCCFFIIALSFCSSVLAQQDEKLTITTYYPSPTGRYNTLWTNTLGVGDTSADGSITSADIPDPVSEPGAVRIAGNVQIGTNITGDANLMIGNISRVTYATMNLAGLTNAGQKGMRIHYNNNPLGDLERAVIDVRGKSFSIRGVNSTIPGDANANRLLINLTNGYVGIGTPSPQSILHVRGLPYDVAGDITRLSVQMGAEGASDAVDISFWNTTSSLLGGFVYNSPLRTAYGGSNSMNLVQHQNANLTFATSNTVRATIDGTGRMHLGNYYTGFSALNSFGMEIGGNNPVAASGNATILFHDWGVIANQLRYKAGVLYWEASSSVPGYGTTTTPALQVGGNIIAGGDITAGGRFRDMSYVYTKASDSHVWIYDSGGTRRFALRTSDGYGHGMGWVSGWADLAENMQPGKEVHLEEGDIV